jgi:cytoskeletal protein RodZ
MTRLFKRNNKTTIAELEEYYANQDRKKTKTSMAWLMAVLSLVITLAVIAMIFFGGRWLYRTLTDDDNTTTADTTTGQVELPTFDSDVLGRGAGQDRSTDDTSAGQSSTGTVSDSAASTSIPNTDRVDTDASSNDGTIPNTGAGELLIIAPIAAGVTGYLVSRKRHIKNS